jgi:hypothetical protein
MRTRSLVLAVSLAAAVLAAGCDTCVDCLCHCTGNRRAGGGDTVRLQYYTGFDCGQRCENDPGGCGVGNVSSVECLETKIVEGRPTTVRCAQADPSAAAAARAPRR